MVTWEESLGFAWIAMLAAFGVRNIFHWWNLKIDSLFKKILIGNYVFACFYRSIFMTDVIERVCFTDFLIFGWPIMNRFVASIGECSFGLMLNSFLFPNNKWYKFGILPMIANFLSYIATITKNTYYNVAEECIWFIFTLIAIYTLILDNRWKTVYFAMIVVWTIYLFTIDIPVYYYQRQHHLANGEKTYSLIDGLAHSSQCGKVTQNIVDWYDVWWFHTLYFIFGPTALVYGSSNFVLASSQFLSPAKKTEKKLK